MAFFGLTPFITGSIVAGVSGLISLPLYFKERLFLHPTSNMVQLPHVSYKELSIPYTPCNPSSTLQKEAFLSAWMINPDATKGVILFCTGNGGNKSYHLQFVYDILDIFPDHSILLFDYEGYGQSYSEEGASFDGLCKSTRTALLFLIEWKLRRFAKQVPMIVYSHSIGTTAATAILPYLSAQDTVIYQNGMSSLGRITEHYTPFPLKNLYGSYMDPILNNVKRIQRNKKKRGANNTPYLCVLHCIHDEIIPFSIGKELGEVCDIFIPVGGTHNQIEYTLPVVRQLQQIVGRQG